MAGAHGSSNRHPLPPSPPLSPPQVQRPDGTTACVLLPARFNKRLWIKRGGYLVVTAPPAPDAAAGGGRLAGEVVSVLYAADVARLRRMEGVWPAAFAEEEGGEGGNDEGESDDGGDGSGSSSSGLPPLAANPNRRRPTYATSSSSEEEED